MTKNNNSGFTLIEVLIAAVIVAIGLSGMVALQLKAHHYNRASNIQSHATILAHDMIERVRANPVGLNNGSYHLPTATQHTNCFTTTGCSPTDMAQNDMYEWAGNGVHSVPNTLPLGLATICKDTTPNDGTISDGVISNTGCDNNGSVYAIKIWWKDNDTEMQQFVTTVAF